MSAINGDKARFHRARKKQIQRRLRKEKMLKALGNPDVRTKSPKSV